MHICSGCHRHIRETTCPFCGAESRDPARVAGGSAMYVGIKRGAFLAGVLTVASCSPAVSPGDAAPDASADGPVAAYGIPPDAFPPPPMDAGVDASADGPVAAYGIPPDALPPPPMDAGPDANAFPDGPVAAYGIPPGDQ